MDKKNNKNLKNETISPVIISYQGVDTIGEATNLQNELCNKFSIKIDPPEEIPLSGARLGIGEIFITVVLAATVKTTVDSILNYLEKYYQKKQEEFDNIINIQIIIKKNNIDNGKRFPFHINKAKPMLLKLVFNTIREFISKIMKG